MLWYFKIFEYFCIMMCGVLNMNVCVAGINNACAAIHTYIHTWRANNLDFATLLRLSCFTLG